MEKTLWVLMNPDNEHWDEEFARARIPAAPRLFGICIKRYPGKGGKQWVK